MNRRRLWPFGKKERRKTPVPTSAPLSLAPYTISIIDGSLEEKVLIDFSDSLTSHSGIQGMTQFYYDSYRRICNTQEQKLDEERLAQLSITTSIEDVIKVLTPKTQIEAFHGFNSPDLFTLTRNAPTLMEAAICKYYQALEVFIVQTRVAKGQQKASTPSPQDQIQQLVQENYGADVLAFLNEPKKNMAPIIVEFSFPTKAADGSSFFVFLAKHNLEVLEDLAENGSNSDLDLMREQIRRIVTGISQNRDRDPRLKQLFMEETAEGVKSEPLNIKVTIRIVPRFIVDDLYHWRPPVCREPLAAFSCFAPPSASAITREQQQKLSTEVQAIVAAEQQVDSSPAP